MAANAHHDGTTVIEDNPRSPQRASADLVQLSDRASQVRSAAALITAVTILAAVIALSAVAIITSTIAATTPQGGQLVLTLRGTHPITAVPVGEHITVSAQARDVSWLGRAAGVVGIDGTSTVVVLAGPYGAAPLQQAGNQVSDTQGQLVQVPQILDGQYLARCVEGACTQIGSSVVLVEPNQVLGSPWLVFSPLPTSWQSPERGTR